MFVFRAIDFVVETLRNDGFDNVHTERVDNLPYWVRGNDKVEMIGEHCNFKTDLLRWCNTVENVTRPK